MADGWHWNVVGEYWPLVRNGAIVSVILTVLSIVAGATLGVLLGLITLAARGLLRPLAWIVLAAVELIEALPLLVLLVWLYLALPEAWTWLHELLVRFYAQTGTAAGAVETEVLRAASHPAFATAFVALTIGVAARIAVIIRRGAATVPPSLVETAKAQGMNAFVRLRRVVGPATFRASVTAVARTCLATFKLTTLAAFIGCSEMLNVAHRAVATDGHALEILTMVAVVFLVIALPSSWMISALERSRWLKRSVARTAS